MSEQGTAPDLDGQEWEVTGACSRAGAIADGTLVEVPAALAAEARLTCHVALTRAVWEDCVAWAPADNARKGTVQDQDGRLQNVLWLASLAARRAAARVRVDFTVYRVPRDGRDRKARPVCLVSQTGPGDDGELVVTVTQPGED